MYFVFGTYFILKAIPMSKNTDESYRFSLWKASAAVYVLGVLEQGFDVSNKMLQSQGGNTWPPMNSYSRNSLQNK